MIRPYLYYGSSVALDKVVGRPVVKFRPLEAKKYLKFHSSAKLTSINRYISTLYAIKAIYGYIQPICRKWVIFHQKTGFEGANISGTNGFYCGYFRIWENNNHIPTI